MKQHIQNLIKNSLNKLGIDYNEKIIFTIPKDEKFGDFSTNIALVLGKKLNINPRKLAEDIVNNIKN